MWVCGTTTVDTHRTVPYRTVLGPSKLHGGVVQLERHPGSRVDRLRVVSHTIWTDHKDLDSMLTIFQQALARKHPFMVIWDVRSLTFPRVRAAQVEQVRSFLGGFAVQFDTYVQAHIIIISNPGMRAQALRKADPIEWRALLLLHWRVPLRPCRPHSRSRPSIRPFSAPFLRAPAAIPGHLV